MTPHDRDSNDEPKPGPVIITDKRHSREIEEVEPAEADPAPAPAPAAQPAPEPPATPEPPAGPERVVEFTRPAPAAGEVPGAPAPEAHEPGAEVDEDAYAAAELEHLKMLFGAGLVNYLRSQLGLLLNFAVIGLGRAPNPATGLVSTELDKAKLAIDLLEFVALRLKGQLPAPEEQEISQILAELKYTFLQLAAGGPQPPAGGEA